MTTDRDELATALREIHDDGRDWSWLANELMPAVEKVAARRAAEELRAAAAALADRRARAVVKASKEPFGSTERVWEDGLSTGYGVAESQLRDRADAVDAS